MNDIGVAIIKFTTFINVCVFVCVCALCEKKTVFTAKKKEAKTERKQDETKWIESNEKGFVVVIEKPFSSFSRNVEEWQNTSAEIYSEKYEKLLLYEFIWGDSFVTNYACFFSFEG